MVVSIARFVRNQLFNANVSFLAWVISDNQSQPLIDYKVRDFRFLFLRQPSQVGLCYFRELQSEFYGGICSVEEVWRQLCRAV